MMDNNRGAQHRSCHWHTSREGESLCLLGTWETDKRWPLPCICTNRHWSDDFSLISFLSIKREARVRGGGGGRAISSTKWSLHQRPVQFPVPAAAPAECALVSNIDTYSARPSSEAAAAGQLIARTNHFGPRDAYRRRTAADDAANEFRFHCASWHMFLSIESGVRCLLQLIVGNRHSTDVPYMYLYMHFRWRYYTQRCLVSFYTRT